MLAVKFYNSFSFFFYYLALVFAAMGFGALINGSALVKMQRKGNIFSASIISQVNVKARVGAASGQWPDELFLLGDGIAPSMIAQVAHNHINALASIIFNIYLYILNHYT